MHKIFVTAIVGAMLATAQTQPTAAELLQKGIYSQEVAGDLDGAIKIYRQIVESHPSQREIGAQAQYRLGMTLLEKGDSNGASQEIQRLGWDYPDYKDLIAASKSAGGPGHVLAAAQFGAVFRPGVGIQPSIQFSAAAPSHDAEFDFTKSVTVTGTVQQVQWLNPYVWVTVNSNGGAPQYRISLASPNTLMQTGWSKDTVKAGDQVSIAGAPAREGFWTLQATSVSANGKVIFTRSAMAAQEQQITPQQTAAARDLAMRAALEAQKLEIEHDARYDFSTTTTVTGVVTQAEMGDPSPWMLVTPAGGGQSVRVSLEAIGAHARAGGVALKPGDQLTVIGAPARDGSSSLQATSISSTSGGLIYQRAAPLTIPITPAR